LGVHRPKIKEIITYGNVSIIPIVPVDGGNNEALVEHVPELH
jgi:hypothetical protein